MLDNNMNVKIIDFGFAATTASFLKTKCGTFAYMAPEILIESPYQGTEVDLFALGVILFLLVRAKPPFSRAAPND